MYPNYKQQSVSNSQESISRMPKGKVMTVLCRICHGAVLIRTKDESNWRSGHRMCYDCYGEHLW